MNVHGVSSAIFRLILPVAAILVTASAGLNARAADGSDTAGCFERTMTMDGLKRSYILCVPNASEGLEKPLPVVMVFHGAFGNAADTKRSSSWHKSGTKRGFITVYPNGCLWGSCNGGMWNADSSPELQGWSEQQGIDDKGFVAAILHEVSLDHWVDWSRIYAVGTSGGGIFTLSLACDMADTFAAVSVTASTLTDATCQPSEKVTVLHVHGADDTLVSFAGQSVFGLPPAAESIAFWQTANNCSRQMETTYNDGTTVCRRLLGCDAGGNVEWCVVKGADHFFFPFSSWFPLDDRFWNVVYGASKEALR